MMELNTVDEGNLSAITVIDSLLNYLQAQRNKLWNALNQEQPDEFYRHMKLMHRTAETLVSFVRPPFTWPSDD